MSTRDACSYAQVPAVDPGHPRGSTFNEQSYESLSADEAMVVQIIRVLRSHPDMRNPVDRAILSGAREILEGLLELAKEAEKPSSKHKSAATRGELEQILASAQNLELESTGEQPAKPSRIRKKRRRSPPA